MVREMGAPRPFCFESSTANLKDAVPATLRVRLDFYLAAIAYCAGLLERGRAPIPGDQRRSIAGLEPPESSMRP